MVHLSSACIYSIVTYYNMWYANSSAHQRVALQGRAYYISAIFSMFSWFSAQLTSLPICISTNRQQRPCTASTIILISILVQYMYRIHVIIPETEFSVAPRELYTKQYMIQQKYKMSGCGALKLVFGLAYGWLCSEFSMWFNWRRRRSS